MSFRKVPGCDCHIGTMHSYTSNPAKELYLSTVVDQAIHRSNAIGNVISPADIIGRNENFATLFKLCPKCERHVRWTDLRKKVKNESLN